MDTLLRAILSAMGCLAIATALSLRSGQLPTQSQPKQGKPIGALNPLSRVHSLYNVSKAVLDLGLAHQWAHGEDVPWVSRAKPYYNETLWFQEAHDGSIRWERAASIATFIELCQPQNMLEIGSFLGLSSNFYLRLMEPWGGRLTSVDPNVRHRIFDAPRDIFNFVNAPFPDRLQTFDEFWMNMQSEENGHFGYTDHPPFYDNATIQKIFDERTVLRPKDLIDAGLTFDMASIDGAHDYDSVMGDFENILSVMKPGSCIIFDNVHEHEWPGTYKAFMEIYKEAVDSEQGLAMFGDHTALFIDRGLIASRKQAAGNLATASSSKSTKEPVVEALSNLHRVHEFYNESVMRLEQELACAWTGCQGTPRLSAVQPDISETELYQQARDGSIRWDRAASLATFIELCQPRHMLEIGSFLGLSSNFFLGLMEPWGGRLTSVDPNVRHRIFDAPRDIFHGVNSLHSYSHVHSRLQTFDAFWMNKTSQPLWGYKSHQPFYDSASAQALFDEKKVLTPKDFIAAGQTFDMAFIDIDGADDYDSVRGDFENLLPVMEPGSCVIFDDFDEHARPGTYRAFMDIYKEALASEQGLAVFGDQAALFIDRGLIASRRIQVG